MRRVVAAAVDDARREVDERVVGLARAAVDPRVQRLEVPRATHVVRLHVIEPVEEASDPPQLGVIVAADGLGVGAEVDLREERLAPAVLRLLAQKVIELAEVAHACRLDGAAPPPAAPLDVSARLAAHDELGVGGVLAAAFARLPVARTLVVHVHAALAGQQAGIARALVHRRLHVRKVVGVLVEHFGRHVGRGRARTVVKLAARRRVERRLEDVALVPRGTLAGAPAAIVPARRLGYDGARRAEKRRRRAVPSRVRLCDDHHVRVDGALQVLCANRLARLRVDHVGALVVLVRLPQLAACRRGRVRGAAHAVDDGLVRPVVLVACVVLDRLMHRLRDEGGEIGEAIQLALLVVSARVEGEPGDTCCRHLGERRHHVLPCVDLARLPARGGGALDGARVGGGRLEAPEGH
mmetsp:Transcript_16490/g.35735  ORF Transcript_16490/g.35735 Transcript_16490/m.35735 type:complete len:410 (+) Transcript_16490:105-1334(+)